MVNLQRHIDSYFQELRLRGLSGNTLTGYGRDISKFVSWLGENAVEDLTRTDIRAFVVWLSKSGLSPSSVGRAVSGVRGLLEFLFVEDVLTHDPTEDLTLPQRERYLPGFLGAEAVAAVFDVPDTSTAEGMRDYAILELFYGSGLRVSELADIFIGDADLKRGLVTVTGKGSKTRIVPMSSSSVSAIKRYLRYRIAEDGEKHLFVTKNGDKLTRFDIYNRVREIAERAGFPGVSPHTLRHTFATHLSQRGVDVRYIQQMLGHKSVATTQIYTHITNDDLKRKYDKFQMYKSFSHKYRSYFNSFLSISFEIVYQSLYRARYHCPVGR